MSKWSETSWVKSGTDGKYNWSFSWLGKKLANVDDSVETLSIIGSAMPCVGQFSEIDLTIQKKIKTLKDSNNIWRTNILDLYFLEFKIENLTGRIHRKLVARCDRVYLTTALRCFSTPKWNVWGGRNFKVITWWIDLINSAKIWPNQ